MTKKFAYVAFDRGGKSVPGVIEAPGEAEAREMLRHKGLFVTSVEETLGGATVRRSTGGKPAKRRRRGAAVKQLTNFTRQMHVLLASGTPLTQALGALERQTKDADFHSVLCDVRKQVEEGIALSEAMRAHPQYFDDVCRSLISAGEAGGKIDAMLDRLARLTRSEAHVRSSVVGAMIYPALLIVISIAVMVILLTFVLPRFAGLFGTLGSELPPTTKVVVAVSDFLRGYWWMVLGVVIGAYYLVRAWLRTPPGRRTFDAAVVRMPMIGRLVRSFCTARITRILGIQLESKVPLLDALKLTRQAAGNLMFQDLIAAAEDAATRGQNISVALVGSPLVDPAITEAIRSGEQTGQLSTLLISVSDFLDEENEVIIRSLTSIIEPMILIVLGVMVGFVALSMFLPLFDLTATTGGG